VCKVIELGMRRGEQKIYFEANLVSFFEDGVLFTCDLIRLARSLLGRQLRLNSSLTSSIFESLASVIKSLGCRSCFLRYCFVFDFLTWFFKRVMERVAIGGVAFLVYERILSF